MTYNASCTYAKPFRLKELEIRGAAFRWIVPDDTDTTVNENSNCAYDRAVLTKELMPHFDKWGVAAWFDDQKVSDHWPIWLSLKVGP